MNAYAYQCREWKRRRAAIRAARARGWSLGRIAERFGISRARVHQILRAAP